MVILEIVHYKHGLIQFLQCSALILIPITLELSNGIKSLLLCVDYFIFPFITKNKSYLDIFFLTEGN